MFVVSNSYPDDSTVEVINKYNKYFIHCKQFISNIYIKFFLPSELKPYSISIFNSYLLKNISQKNLDFIHLHWVNFEMLSINEIANFKSPIIWTIHDMWPFSGITHIENSFSKKSLKYKIFKLTNSKILEYKKNYWDINKFNLVVPSKWMFKKIKEESFMKNWNITIIPNPIDTYFWNNDNSYDYNSKTIKIGFGAIGYKTDNNKGYNLFLNSLQVLKNNINFNNIEIFTFGDEFPDEIKVLGYKIKHFGKYLNKEKLRSYYSSLDLFVVPSRIESFGQVATEASACGIPVVGFDSSGLNDIIIHKTTGYLAKSYNIEDLSFGILWVINNLKFKTLISENCRNNIIHKFSYEVVSNQYIDLYNKIKYF